MLRLKCLNCETPIMQEFCELTHGTTKDIRGREWSEGHFPPDTSSAFSGSIFAGPGYEYQHLHAFYLLHNAHWFLLLQWKNWISVRHLRVISVKTGIQLWTFDNERTMHKKWLFQWFSETNISFWSVTLYIDWYSYPGIICYKYLANTDSAEYRAIWPEQMPGAISG